MSRKLSIRNLATRLHCRFAYLEPFYSLEFDQRTKRYYVVEPHNDRRHGPYRNGQLLALLRHVGLLRRHEHNDFNTLVLNDGTEVREEPLSTALKLRYVSKLERRTRDILNPPQPLPPIDYERAFAAAQCPVEVELPEPDEDFQLPASDGLNP